MKKAFGIILALMLISLAAYALAEVEINETTFPDTTFRNYVLDIIDKSEDGTLQDEEISAVREISLHDSDVSSLTGIEYFTSLDYLYCYSNNLSSLDLSKNTNLYSLECQANKLTSLDLSNNTKLNYLECYMNNLDSLNVKQCPDLAYLDCYKNNLTSLDVSNNTKLECLYFDSNKLSKIDISKNTLLTVLAANDNRLTSLDVSNSSTLCKLVQTCSRETKTSPVIYDIFQINTSDLYAFLMVDPKVTVIAGSFTSKPTDSSETTPPSSDPTNPLSSDPTTPPSSDPSTPAVKDEVTVSGGVYKLNHTKLTAVFTGPAKKTATKLTVKDTVKENGKTYKVTEIKARACKGMKKLTTVTIGKNVTKIGKSAFEKCAKLKKITIKNAKMKKAGFGSNCFKGINAKAAFKVPKKVLKNYTTWITKQGKAPKKATIKK